MLYGKVNNMLGIKKINEIMSRYLWMDFELTDGGTNKVVLHGYLDEAEEDKIQIFFLMLTLFYVRQILLLKVDKLL